MNTLSRLVLTLMMTMNITWTTAAADAVDAAGAPKLEIAKFRGGKAGAVTLSFDDGSKDHYTTAMPLLEKYGLHGTFLIVAKRQVEEPNAKNLTWAEVKEMAARGHEIGNHSMTHFQLTKAADEAALKVEIVDPLDIFEAKIGLRPITFCYPGNAKNDAAVAMAEAAHLGSLKGRRQMVGDTTYTVEAMNTWLDEVATKGEARDAMYHGIVEGGGGWKPFASVEVFEATLQALVAHEDRLWVTTCGELFKYELLRDSTTVEPVDAGGTAAGVTGFALKTERAYGYPLTVAITPCPAGTTAIQGAGDKSKSLPITLRDGVGYVDVIPEHGPVTLTQPRPEASAAD